MNLAIDIGNTKSNLAVFNKGEMVMTSRVEGQFDSEAKEIFKNYQVTRVIISGVTADYSSLTRLIDSMGVPVITLSHNTDIPFRMTYSSPETLGPDRIAGIAAAYNKFKGKNVLVIDAGTAVTYDFLSAENEYPGGNISPGLSMRFKALNKFTGRLPLVPQGSNFEIIGRSTEEAIRAGVQLGLIFEINEYIRSFKKNYKDLKVIITGGDGRFLSDNIDYSYIFEPDLIVEGLNFLLDYYAEKHKD